MARQSEGFSLVEVLLAVAIFGFIASGIVGAIIYGRSSNADAGNRTRAVQLADEGIQAIRNIKNASFNNLNDGTYGLTQSSNVWSLSGSSDTSDIYTRQASIATVDNVRKTATVTVGWDEGQGNSQVSIITQLTNWMASIAKLWPNATLAGSLDATGTSNGIEVATQGNYAYMVRGTTANSLVIANISNPAAPTLTSTLTMAASPTNIFVSGNYAYITTSSNTAELQIVNIANPATPTIVGTYDAPGSADGLSVQVVGNYAYLARAANGGLNEFVIVNVSNPAVPTIAGAYGNNVTMNDVYVSGSYAYIGSNSTTQLLVVNISVPLLPILSASFTLSTVGPISSLAGFGTTLLVGQTSTLSVLNISNPLAVTRTGNVTTTGSTAVNEITVDSTNTYAFIGTATTSAEFQVVSLATPSAPTIVKTIDLAGTASTLSGIAYNSTLNVVAGASFSDTQELVVFIPN